MNKENNFDDFLEEAREDFFQEADERIKELESIYLELENNPKDRNNIETIFRHIHTIKGNASAVNFDALKNFSHCIENLLIKIKNEKIQINQNIINILLKSNDIMGSTINKLKHDPHAQIELNDITLIINNVEEV